MISVGRFVDVGSETWKGTCNDFIASFDSFRHDFRQIYGLDLAFEVRLIVRFSQFSDNKFKFDNGMLAMAIYMKPTDADRLLEFSRCHHKHPFPNTVFSIDDDQLLEARLSKLKGFFIASSYPGKIVDSALDKIKALPRHLEHKE